MKGLLRKLRGMVGLGVIWAALWTPIGVGIVALQWLVSGYGLPPLDLVALLVVSGAKNGFLAGAVFAGGLGLAYRSRGFADLSPGVLGLLGGAAGMMLPAGAMIATAVTGYFAPSMLTVVMSLGLGGALGAVTAVGSLKMAQAAPRELDGPRVEGLLT